MGEWDWLEQMFVEEARDNRVGFLQAVTELLESAPDLRRALAARDHLPEDASALAEESLKRIERRHKRKK